MEMHKAFKFELRPKGEHIRKMKRFCGCARFVFNKALDLSIKQYEQDKTSKFSYTKLANLLPEWKADTKTEFLKTVQSQTLQQSLKDLERSYKNFFEKRAEFPKFKKKGIKDSFRYPQGIKLDQGNNRIYLPKIGWIRYHNSQEVVGKIKNVTVSSKNDKWYVSIQTEFEINPPLPNGGEIGIDVGIARFATLSNGEFYKSINSFKTHQKRIAKLQRQLSHKVKFSKNWIKAKKKISKLYSKIANIRKDYLHKISNEICKNHAIIFVEDLKVDNMSKSAKGNAAKHGKNVEAKSGLNKSILDQGWGEFFRELEYKSAWCGGYFYKVPPRNTSRTCIKCGHVSKDNRKSQSHFHCVKCGFEANADLVGAVNVLEAGHALLACEVNHASGQQQEPTEAVSLC